MKNQLQEQINENSIQNILKTVPFRPGERSLSASSVELKDGIRLFVVDAQQTANIENKDLAVYRSVSGCTILELEFEDHIEVFHISAGTFSAIQNYPDESNVEGNDVFFSRMIRRLGEKSGVLSIKYYVNQTHKGFEERRRERIFQLNETALKNISANCKIFEIRKADGSQTEDMFESVNILSNGEKARVLEHGYIIEEL